MMTIRLVCRGCGGPRHAQGTETIWYYECRGLKRMNTLNDFHEQNWQRMHEAFSPPHSLTALIVCVGEEIGELCAAALGVTGEKKRKAHLTNGHVLDACADAATYLSLVVGSVRHGDLESLVGSAWIMKPESPDLLSLVAKCQCAAGHLAQAATGGNTHSVAQHAAFCFVRLVHVAEFAGCRDWPRLLGDTFNMVSERAGSSIKTTLGQP